jgi:hypothetical protein
VSRGLGVGTMAGLIVGATIGYGVATQMRPERVWLLWEVVQHRKHADESRQVIGAFEGWSECVRRSRENADSMAESLRDLEKKRLSRFVTRHEAPAGEAQSVYADDVWRYLCLPAGTSPAPETPRANAEQRGARAAGRG